MARKMENVELPTERRCTGRTCKVVKPSDDLSNEITVFTAKCCGACKKRVPGILKKANAVGLKVRLIDTDEVDLEKATPRDRKMFRRVEFVPHIDYMGHQIEEEELDQIIKTRAPKEAQ